MANTNESIEYNSEEINNAIATLDKSLGIIQTSIAPSINEGFSVLADLGLFASGLEKIKEQVASLEGSNKNLMTKIGLHADELEALEESIIAEIEKDAISYYTYTGGGGSYYTETPEITVTETVQEALNLNLMEEIPSMDDVSVGEFVSFVNVNRGSFSISQVLFNLQCSGLIYLLLRKFYKDNSEDINFEVNEESMKVHKAILTKILESKDSDLEKVLFNEDSIFVAKDYFVRVAKDNNTTVGELMLDEKYNEVLQQSILKLYKGENLVEYQVSDETVEKIRNYVDKTAKNSSLEVDELLYNLDYVDVLKGAKL